MKIFLKSFFQVNFISECKRLRVPVWRCPTVLFLIMGLTVVGAILASYYFAQKYALDPEVQALLALFTAAVTFVTGHFVVQSFSRVAEESFLKSQFLNIISHQLLTPLSSLKWALNLLMANNVEMTEKEREDLFSIINQSNENMINMVNSLLDVSRLDVGKIKLSLEKADSQKLVEEVILGRKQDVQTKGNVLKFEVEENLPAVYTDCARTKIVINNLIDNAIKFSKTNTEIIVSLYREGNKIIFSVEDFGIGISKQQRKNIYKKFFRAENVFRYQTKGFGLGLFTAKFIVDALGGSLNFESREEVGSRFWFSLPVYK